MPSYNPNDKLNSIISIAQFVINEQEHHYDEDHSIESGVLQMKWQTGGVSGGSCWDTGEDDPHYSYSSDHNPQGFSSLDQLIIELVPDFPLSKYQSIIGLVQEDFDTEYEYYGNHTDYAIKRIDLSKLLDFLEKENLLT